MTDSDPSAPKQRQPNHNPDSLRPRLLPALMAEAVGTCVLLATVVGSGVMAENLSQGNTGLALLANTVATGWILFVLISVLAPASGAHFNPAVTWVLVVSGQLSAARGLAYTAVQIGGALSGVWLAHAMFALPLLQYGSKIRSGPSQWLAETVATAGLLAIVVALPRLKYSPPLAGALIGSYISAAYWFTASTSFANPAVTIARAFSDTFAGIRPVDAPAFIGAQVVGAILGAVIIGVIYPRPKSFQR